MTLAPLRVLDAAMDGLRDDLRAAVRNAPHHDLTLRLTLVLLVLHAASSAFLAVPTRILCLLMLTLPALLRHAGLWWLLAGAIVIGNIDEWYSIDNHKYLITYWVLVCALTVRHGGLLHTSARLLVGIAFTFAVFWKVIGGQFLDGSFFYFTSLTGPRLQPFTAALARVDLNQVTLAADSLGYLGAAGSETMSLPLPTFPSIWRAALWLSWTGLLVEATVAALHLAPSRLLYYPRHASIIVFVALTYFLLPVVGFAFTLAVLGMAQCREGDHRLRLWYVALICVIQLTVIPWRNLLPVG